MKFLRLLFAFYFLPSCQSWHVQFLKSNTELQTVVFTEKDSFNFHNRLYFDEAILIIFCQIRDPQNDTDYGRSHLVKFYASKGMAPTIVFSNSTWSTETMEFPQLVEEEKVYWKLNVSKSALMVDNGDWLDNREPWDFTVELGRGLDLFKTRGSLVVKEMEPLLSVQLGDKLKEIPTAFLPQKSILWRSPCSPNVAVILPTFNTTLQPYSGCYLGITSAAFAAGTTSWFNLLHLSAINPDAYSICKEAAFSSCATLTIWDFIVADNHILFLTSKGVVRSEDIAKVAQTKTVLNSNKVKFYFVSSIHPTIDTRFRQGSFKQEDSELHFIQDCFDGEDTRNSSVYLVFHLHNADSHELESMLFTSTKPFEKWNELKLKLVNVSGIEKFVVHGMAEGIQRQTLLMLMEDTKQSRNLFAVLGDGLNRELLYPLYNFPTDARLTGLQRDSYTNNIYAYGTQVWCSQDRGGSFHKIQQLSLNDFVVSFGVTYTGEAITFNTKLGSVYYGKLGTFRVSRLESSSGSSTAPSVVGSDQQGSIYKVRFSNKNNILSLKSTAYDTHGIIKKNALQYSRPLLLQLITEQQVHFYTYCNDLLFTDALPCTDTFNLTNIGMVLKSRYGGAAVITGVGAPNKTKGIAFGQQVDAVIISPFQADISNTTLVLMGFQLEVNWQDHTTVLLSLLKDESIEFGWLGSDIGKTVVLSDGVSFIISDCANTTVAYAESLAFGEGRTVPDTAIYKEGSWTIYDFRPYDATQPSAGQRLKVSPSFGEMNRAEVLPGGLLFLSSHEGMVLRVGSTMGRIVSVINASTAMINFGSQCNSVPGNYTGGWSLIRTHFNNNNNNNTPSLYKIWWLAEHECQSTFLGDNKLGKLSYYLDSKDELHLSVKAVRKSNAFNTKALITVSLGNPRLFAAETHYSISELNHTLHLTLKQRPLISGMSLVTVHLQDVSLLCHSTSLRIAVYSLCPPAKRLKFMYPLSFSRSDFINRNAVDKKGIDRSFRLPINYRPPSSRGKAIPMSSNIYNAHPEQPPYRDAYKITRSNLRYKQCRGKQNRKSCECTAEMETSSYEMHSDCITTVYRLLYSETLKPTFQVLQEGNTKTLAFPYYLTELNRRKDFEIFHISTLTITNLQVPILEPSQSSFIEFKGSGLFHFRAHIVQQGFTFCSLTDEFLVYVDETPLAHPVQDIVRTCTGMAFACLLYVVYMWKFYGKNRMKNE